MPQLQNATKHSERYDNVLLSPTMGVPGSSSPARTPRLLLVENDTAICALLTEALSARYHVAAVSDGLAAWQAAQHLPLDLVIVGLYIRGTDSLILIQSLRADSRTAMLPIIVLTSSVDRDLMLRCLNAGASNFLLKPFGITELLACVQLELELHGTLTEPRKQLPGAS